MSKHFMHKALALAALAVAPLAHADWTLLGDAASSGGMLILSTAYTEGEDAPFNATGHPAVWIDTLELAAGVPFHALDLPDEPAYEGSLAMQTFAVQAGDEIRFFYQFNSFETQFQDLAFLVVNGNVLPLARLGNTPPLGAWYTYAFTGSGNATVGFGVVDTGDVNGVSRLSVSQFTLAPVPEPGAWALLLAGGAGLAGWRRLRDQGGQR